MAIASAEQRKAADPRQSVWVSANAGAGKTTVLTGRVVRLLLAGADPSRILCVTFTKAAAANMQDRVFRRLGDWVALDNDALASAIEELTGEPPRADDIPRARRLFARAVETPGGLKIQTIHGFCERLLHSFPFEAAVPARFKVLDDREQRDATEAAINAMLNAALKDPDGPLGRALAVVTTQAGETGFREALKAFMAQRRNLDPPERKFAVSPLRQRLNIKPGETAEALQREVLNNGLYSSNWRAIRDWLKSSGKDRDAEMAAFLDAGYGFQGEQKFESYIRVFLTADGGPRTDKGWFVSADLRKKPGGYLDAMIEERTRVHENVQRINAVLAAERTEAITLLADHVNALYRAEKRRMGRLDFPDLIGKVVTLLTTDTAKWVLYKLDQGLDHILVDEAQDTSPEQWAIVKALADDFFAGEGARQGARRTIFAVGDEKQSIFGFQGARPEEFENARQHFARRIDAFNTDAPSKHAFDKVPLQISYRTVHDVLSAVDQVFSVEERFRGLSSDNQRTVHGSNRQGEPGLVELWPAREAEKHIEKDAFEPVDATPVDAPSMLLARRTARRIRYWKDSHACFEDDGAPITPGDVLVLVRNRGPLFDGVIKALKKEGVPVAGADRMTLNEQIVVLDLLALGRFCLLPEDDLNLAALLKSPLIGLDDEALESIAHGRGDISLWAALQRRGGEAPYAAAVVRLTEWQALARRFDPYGFYGEVLSAGHGRRDLLARLGVDAEEAINVFLATLRQWQASHPPSLLGFVEAMAANDSDVKRDMEEAHGRVRVMTVHASKGLEARIVFLIDTAHNPKGGGNSGPKLLEIDEGDVETAVWVKGEKSDPPALAPARERANEAAMAESRRLLYVALTRARDRLYIGTAQGQKAPPDGHWRGMIDAALTGHANLREVQAEDGEGPVQQWRSTQNPRIKPPVEAETVKSRPDHPNWLMQRPERKDLPRPPPLRPSRLVDAAEPPPLRDGVTARVNARLRGDLIHHLLQHLPDVASARRQIVAERLASARFPALDASLRAESIADTLSLMAEPSLLPLFEGEGRNEVEIAGEVTIGGRKAEVAGRIDRLSVTADSVTLVDYKTGRPPKDATAVPESHLQQLAIYEMLLRDLYPDRVITTAIIWTVLPEIVVIPPVDLSRARDSITLP